MNGEGDQIADEATEVALWYDDRSLCLRARCRTAAMDRVRDLVSRGPAYGRDEWGDDALELQVDVGLTRREYLHIILPPTGLPVTYRGFNNRHLQGWHPDFEFRVALGDEEWSVEASFPFSELGRIPADGESWGLNVVRTNPSEPGGYVQWAPTSGDALRPELFGTLTFGECPASAANEATAEQQARRRAEQIDAYTRHAADRRSYFLSAINSIEDRETLDALQVADWATWAEYLAARRAPEPLRWDAVRPGAEGIPAMDRPIALNAANSLACQIEGWSLEPPDPAVFAVERLEALGDAYLLTREGRYVASFERAVRVHDRFVRQKLAAGESMQSRADAGGLYHDYQIIRAAMLGYVYLSMRDAGLSPQTHATAMRTMLRAGRFAAFNISTAYNYGNHQIYESAGLAIVALLFPEFPESDDWARIASRAIRLHLECEVDSDGGYLERCGYHSVAMDFTMQAVASIRANRAESRFPELMNSQTLGTLEHMHEWLLSMTTPDGVLPAFGDYGAHSQIRFLFRAAEFFARPDFAWPVRQLAPDLLPAAAKVSLPAQESVSMDASGFTAMRDGWDADGLYMAVDHGPLGGQHSHVDNMGFVAYAHGRPIALDSGIGTTYSDPRYRTWFRKIRAHNVVVVNDLEPEKVAERTLWHSGQYAEFLEMQSRGLEHALGIRHDRRIVFAKGLGWLIHDRLYGPEGGGLPDRQVDWVLHSPLDLFPDEPGVLHGASPEGGLLVLVARPRELEEPQLEQLPAAVSLPEVRAMRQIDGMRQFGERLVRDITSLTLRKKPNAAPIEFAVFLLPYRGDRPGASFVPADRGWELRLADGRTFSFQGQGAALIERGETVWREEA